MVTVTVRPIADGTYKQCLIYPTTPSTHFDKVDETTPNDATDYVYTGFGDGLAHSNVVDTFVKGSTGIPSGSTINSVTVFIRAHTVPTPSGSKVSYGIALYEGGVLTLVKPFSYTAWTTSSRAWTTNPRTGNAWTVSEVEALEVGFVSDDSYDAIGDESFGECSTVWVEIDYTPPTVAAKKIFMDGFVFIGTLIYLSTVFFIHFDRKFLFFLSKCLNALSPSCMSSLSPKPFWELVLKDKPDTQRLGKRLIL